MGEKITGVAYKVREGAYGLVFDGDKVAVVQVRDTHLLLGGGLEENESIIECLKREFIEEIDFTIKNIKFLDQYRELQLSVRANIYHQIVANVYIVELDNKVSDDLEEAHTLVWLNVYNIKEKMGLEYQSHAIQRAYNLLGVNHD